MSIKVNLDLITLFVSIIQIQDLQFEVKENLLAGLIAKRQGKDP